MRALLKTTHSPSGDQIECASPGESVSFAQPRPVGPNQVQAKILIAVTIACEHDPVAFRRPLWKVVALRTRLGEISGGAIASMQDGSRFRCRE